MNLQVGMEYNYAHSICKLFQKFGSIIMLGALENICLSRKVHPHELSRLFPALRCCEIENVAIKIHNNPIL